MVCLAIALFFVVPFHTARESLVHSTSNRELVATIVTSFILTYGIKSENACANGSAC
jgi:hypothetical protein